MGEHTRNQAFEDKKFVLFESFKFFTERSQKQKSDSWIWVQSTKEQAKASKPAFMILGPKNQGMKQLQQQNSKPKKQKVRRMAD